jgi:hypothetical protein
MCADGKSAYRPASQRVERMHPSGLVIGRTYTVVPVKCNEISCISHTLCGVECGAIGMLEEQDTQQMICKTYQTAWNTRERERLVTWVRK